MLLRGWTLWDALNRSAARNLSSGNAAAFAQKRRKKRHFLRETRRIYRDDSGRQLPFSTNAERNDASFAKRVKSAAMVQGGRSLFPQAQKETTLPSRNAANLPRWFRAVTAFLRKRQGTALPSGNAAILFRTIYPGALFSSASAKGMRISCALRRRRSPRPPQRQKIPYFASSRKAGMTSWICGKGH